MPNPDAHFRAAVSPDDQAGAEKKAGGAPQQMGFQNPIGFMLNSRPVFFQKKDKGLGSLKTLGQTEGHGLKFGPQGCQIVQISLNRYVHVGAQLFDGILFLIEFTGQIGQVLHLSLQGRFFLFEG